MVYLYDACDQISDFCHQQLLRKMRQKISWTDRRTEVKQYTLLPFRDRGYKNQWYTVSQLLLEQNIWQTWLLVFLPPKLSVVLKINILHQSKNYKNHFENSNFWGMWPLGHVGHVTFSFINMLFVSTGIFVDKLRPQFCR
jgi:hypothetical protein